MLNWYDWILMGFAILIIVLCLLQGGKSEGASGAITGGGLNVFVKTKERGAEKVVSILTLICAILFFFTAIRALSSDSSICNTSLFVVVVRFSLLLEIS